jgi:hypothetical protein
VPPGHLTTRNTILGRVYFVDTYSECGGFGPLARQLELLLTPSGIDR